MIAGVLAEGVIAAALIALGVLGLRGGFEPPAWLDEEERASRVAVRRRGAVTCLVIGAVLALAALVGVVSLAS